ncbi:MAG: hypothetical protein KJP04_01375 [Arenicella sp.]|nr:hypothetical protein [Arenicella sp.]
MKQTLLRRGFDLGVIDDADVVCEDPMSNWQLGKPTMLAGICRSVISQHQGHIARSDSLYQAILDGQSIDTLLAENSYQDHLQGRFEMLSSLIHEGEEQEIETVFFDALEEGRVAAEDLWMKVSWLAFYEQDASLRFRFSFGADHVEDVAADPLRQRYAAKLCDVIFPESRIITNNPALENKLLECLNGKSYALVERIIYFNAPQGGAYLHHDRERGHAGVVYAQLSGTTFWLALTKRQLQHEINSFLQESTAASDWPRSIGPEMQLELLELSKDDQRLAEELESFSNDALIHLINETAGFVQQLIRNGHGRLLRSGDVLLLPQQSTEDCCWHSVFCVGDDCGEALSFAIRTD